MQSVTKSSLGPSWERLYSYRGRLSQSHPHRPLHTASGHTLLAYTRTARYWLLFPHTAVLAQSSGWQMFREKNKSFTFWSNLRRRLPRRRRNRCIPFKIIFLSSRISRLEPGDTAILILNGGWCSCFFTRFIGIGCAFFGPYLSRIFLILCMVGMSPLNLPISRLVFIKIRATKVKLFTATILL